MPLRRNRCKISTAASGEFRARAARKSDDTTEKVQRRRRAQLSGFRFPLIVDAPCIIDGEAIACDYNAVASFDLVRHHRAQNFPLNLPINRRLCSTVEGRIVEGWTAHCCAVSAARSRAATMTNLARSSLALALPALFGAAKSCALVNLFMIWPRGRLVASRQRPGIGCPTLLRYPRPRNHIVPHQINVRVAIRYRTA